MALEFLTDAQVGDAGLVIRLDLEGLHALMRTLETAMEARLEPIALQGGGGGAGDEAVNAFATVSVIIVEAAQEDEADAAGDRRPADPSPA